MELRDALEASHRVPVVSNGTKFNFVPSNPWGAVGWREQNDVEVNLTEVFARRNIDFFPQSAERVHPAEKRLSLLDGTDLAYDHLVITTGPGLAFDEIPGFGPEARNPVGLLHRPCAWRKGRVRPPARQFETCHHPCSPE